MELFKTIKEVKHYLSDVCKLNKSVGFVPTMGALHKGHISLIEASKKENDITVSSIFINPIQFNNKKDFEKYPVTIDKDIDVLKAAGCDVLFNPSVEEMYPNPVYEKYDFGKIETVMEGAMRPGHFNGVAIVVKKLFEIINPDKSYFGEKDFQQLLIIKQLVEKLDLPVKIIACPIIREADGLAMSSRNMRLSQEKRKIAPEIYRILSESVKLRNHKSVQESKNFVINEINRISDFRLEYFEISDSVTLQPITSWKSSYYNMGFIAVYLDEIRLIDNVKYF